MKAKWVRVFEEVVWGPQGVEWARVWGGAALGDGGAIGGGARSSGDRRWSDEVGLRGGISKQVSV